MAISVLSRKLHRFNVCLALVVAWAALAAPRTARAEVAVNVFGFSHHLNASDGSGLREFNPGAGLQWTFAETPRGALNGNLGVYQDSYGHANWHLSLGARVRVVGGLWLGAQMINAVSASLNDGYPVLTPYPLLTARLRTVDVHMAYIPEAGAFNGLSTVATFFTVHPWGDGAEEAEDAGGAAAGQQRSWQALEFTVHGLDDISGLAGSGLIWRHMFDDGHGLRLGTQLDGEIRKEIRGEVESDADGSYSATLLLQYLHRHEPRGHVRPYWATGLENAFWADSGSAALDIRWRTDVGVEYELSRNAALALESGLDVGFSRTGHDVDYTPDRRESRISARGARMMLVARHGGGDDAGRTRPESTNGVGPALIVVLGPNLTVRPLDNSAIAWRRLDDAGRGWRWLVRPELNSENGWSERTKNYGLMVRAEHLRRQVGIDGVADYWGLGPLISYRYGEQRWDYDGDTQANLRRSLAIGVGAVVGAEFRIVGDIHLMAEYAASLRWERELASGDRRRTSWQIANDDVRLGIVAGFGN